MKLSNEALLLIAAIAEVEWALASESAEKVRELRKRLQDFVDKELGGDRRRLFALASCGVLTLGYAPPGFEGPIEPLDMIEARILSQAKEVRRAAFDGKLGDFVPFVVPGDGVHQ